MFRRIGIALAAYQPDRDFFFEQLRSIQSQSYEDWICFISFDSSYAAVKSDERFQGFFGDSRFYWDENPKKLGHLKNFERAIRSVTALGVDAVACCDQDDVWFPEKLKVSLNALNQVGDLGLVFSDMKLIDEAGKTSDLTAWAIERRGVAHCGTFDLLVRNVVPGTGMLMDKALVERFPLIPEAALFHDHWYPLVASSVGAVRPLAEPLYGYRIHGDNVVGVTPYSGLLNTSSLTGGIVEKCISVWMRSHDLASEAWRSGLPIGSLARWAFLEKWDLGCFLIVRGLFCLSSDPGLARACFARALGKILSLGRRAKS